MAEPGIRYAYATLEIKSRQTSPASPRLIEGIISTPTPDHIGDVLEPGGAKFALPMPLLWDHKEPIGQVLEASVFPHGIRIKGQVATIDRAGPPANRDRQALAANQKRARARSVCRMETARGRPLEIRRSACKGLEMARVLRRDRPDERGRDDPLDQSTRRASRSD